MMEGRTRCPRAQPGKEVDLGLDSSPAIGCPHGKVHFGRCPRGSKPQPNAAHPGRLRPQSSHRLEGRKGEAGLRGREGTEGDVHFAVSSSTELESERHSGQQCQLLTVTSDSKWRPSPARPAVPKASVGANGGSKRSGEHTQDHTTSHFIRKSKNRSPSERYCHSVLFLVLLPKCQEKESKRLILLDHGWVGEGVGVWMRWWMQRLGV